MLPLNPRNPLSYLVYLILALASFGLFFVWFFVYEAILDRRYTGKSGSKYPKK